MKEKIGLQDLAALLAEKAEITKRDAETFLREYFELMNEELINSGLIKIKDLGTFKLSMMEDRESIDVTTGERVLIPAHNKVVFSPDRKLSETVNEPFAFFETTEIEDDSFLEDIKTPPVENLPSETETSLVEETEEIITEEPVPEKEEEIILESNPPQEEEEEIVYNCEPAQEEEEEVVYTCEPEQEEEEEVVYTCEPDAEEEEEIISMDELTQEEDSSDSKSNFKKKCNNCRELKSLIIYKKRYSKAQKKIKRLRLIIYLLILLSLCSLGFIAYLEFGDQLSFKFF